jgi:hypothetical protein
MRSGVPIHDGNPSPSKFQFLNSVMIQTVTNKTNGVDHAYSIDFQPADVIVSDPHAGDSPAAA